MPTPAQEQAQFLIHSEKFAVREAASRAPHGAQAAQLVALIERVGMNDGSVMFSPAQASYLSNTLIPWARENDPFGGGSRA